MATSSSSRPASVNSAKQRIQEYTEKLGHYKRRSRDEGIPQLRIPLAMHVLKMPGRMPVSHLPQSANYVPFPPSVSTCGVPLSFKPKYQQLLRALLLARTCRLRAVWRIGIMAFAGMHGRLEGRLQVDITKQSAQEFALANARERAGPAAHYRSRLGDCANATVGDPVELHTQVTKSSHRSYSVHCPISFAGTRQSMRDAGK